MSALPWRGWSTTGVQTAPVAATLLADTTPLPMATFEFRVIQWASVGVELTLEWVAADGVTVLNSQVIAARWPLPSWIFELAITVVGQRVRIRTRADATGDVQASLFWRPIR